MVDTDSLRRAVQRFDHQARPSFSYGSDPCTADDMNQVIDETVTLFKAFITELEKSE